MTGRYGTTDSVKIKKVFRKGKLDEFSVTKTGELGAGFDRKRLDVQLRTTEDFNVSLAVLATRICQCGAHYLTVQILVGLCFGCSFVFI